MTKIPPPPTTPYLDREFSFSERGVKVTSKTPLVRMTLREFLLKHAPSPEWEEICRPLRNGIITDRDERKIYKRTHLPAVWPSVILEGGSDAEHIIGQSGLICIDIDEKDNPDKSLEEMADAIESDERTIAFLESCGGAGFAVFMGCSGLDGFEETFRTVQEDFRERGITIDRQCSNPNRARFITHSKTPWIRSNGVPPEIKARLKPAPQSPPLRTQKEFPRESILNRLSQISIDITADREDWLQIAYGLAGEYGEEARGVFHHLSEKYHGYKFEETDDLYTDALRKGRGVVGIGSVFHIADKYGVRVLPQNSDGTVIPTKGKQTQNSRITGGKQEERSAEPSTADLLQKARFVYDPNYIPPPTLCNANGKRFGTQGNFSAITGVEKSGKSFLVNCLIASFLTGDRWGGFESTPPENRAGCLLIDTELGEHDLHNAQKRILSACNESEFKNLYTYRLRPFTSAEALKIAEEAIRTHASQIGLVVIDGITDLMTEGINDTRESDELVRWCMAVSDQYQVHLCVVIHTNSGASKEDTIAGKGVRGHIGKNINRKAETVISVTRDLHQSNRIQVHPAHTRGEKFAPYDIVIESSQTLPREEEVSAVEAQSRAKLQILISDLPAGAHHRLAQKAFKGIRGSEGMKYRELTTAVQAVLDEEWNRTGKRISKNDAEMTVSVWARDGVILKHGKPRSPSAYYTLHPDLLPDGLPPDLRDAAESVVDGSANPEELEFGGGGEVVELGQNSPDSLD